MKDNDCFSLKSIAFTNLFENYSADLSNKKWLVIYSWREELKAGSLDYTESVHEGTQYQLDLI